MLPRCLSQSFCSIWLIVWEQTTNEDFQEGRSGSHLGYHNKMILAIMNLHVAYLPFRSRYGLKILNLGCHNRTILAILNLYVGWMPPIKFQLHPTYRLRGDVVWRISRWLPWQQNDFSNSDSRCLTVSAKSDLPFGSSCHLKFSRWPPWQPSSISEWF